MRIGILALQGAFIEHIHMLESLGAECVALRRQSDIHDLDGLVLPGGESTVQGKLLRELGMLNILKEQIKGGLPVLATCAGLILLSQEIVNDSNVYLGTLPVKVKRNAYGRQLGSFTAPSEFGSFGSVDMIFIRAPYIVETDKNVKILAVADGNIVGVQYKNQIGLSFHPELGTDMRIHGEFLDLVGSFAFST